MKKFTMLMMVSCLALVTSACKSTPKVETKPAMVGNPCELTTSKKVSDAFDETKRALGNQNCWIDFDSHLDTLLVIAAGDPSVEHKEAFGEFLRWSEDQGIIANMQMKEIYTRYFTTYFVSLPKNESNCKVGENITGLTRKLDQEMLDKQKGLLQALGARNEFNKAKRDRDALLLIIAAAGEACKV